jgi:zinc protease
MTAKKKTVADFVYSLESQSSLARHLGFCETARGDAFFQEEYTNRIRRVSTADVQRLAEKYFRPENFVLSVIVPKGSNGNVSRSSLGKIAAKSFKNAFKGRRKNKSEIIQETMQNGVRVVVRENHSVPVVAMSIGFLGGVRAEDEKTNGASNLMSYMLTRGTGRHSAPELSQIIEDMAGSINAFSGRNSFGLKGEFLSEDFEEGLKLLGEMVLTPTFDGEELGKRKKEVLAAIKAKKDSPVSDLVRFYMSVQYGAHPYSMDPLGTPEVVKTITRETLKEFYDRLVFPKNMVVSVSGDVDSRYALRAISNIFEDFLKEGDPSIMERKKVMPPEKAVREEKKINKLQAHFIIGFLGTDFRSKDRYALKVLASSLAGQGGRLFKELRDKKSLAYSLTAFSSEQYDRGFFAFYMGTEGKKLDEGIDAMWNEIIRFLKKGITEDEIDRARNYIMGNYEIGLQSNSSYGESLMFNILYGTGVKAIEEFPERIQHVTRKDVMRVGRKFIDMDKRVVTILSP